MYAMAVTRCLRILVAVGALLGLSLVAVVHAAPPSGLTARVTGEGATVTLGWDRPTAGNAPAYVVQRGVTELRCNGDGCSGTLPEYSEYARVTDPGSGARVEYLDAAPLRGKVNCYRIYLAGEPSPGEAVLGQCVSVPKPAGEAVTLSAPSGLAAEMGSSYRSITLSWPATADTRDGYIVERSITGSANAPREWLKLTPTPVQGDVTSGVVTHEDRFVTRAGWYCYRVRVNAVTSLGPPSTETCLARPVADGPSVLRAPGPPDTGTGRADSAPVALGLPFALICLGLAGIALSRARRRR